MFNKWLAFGPEAMYWAPKFVQSLWKAKEIFITENGCAGDEVILWGGNGSACIDVMDLGAKAETIGYELLARVSPAIRRETVGSPRRPDS